MNKRMIQRIKELARIYNVITRIFVHICTIIYYEYLYFPID